VRDQKPVTSKEKQIASRHSSPVADQFLGLPHRPPFVFVRKLTACEPGISAECETSFPETDPMFAGHFPDEPLVPGVILTEALAQTAGIAAASAHDQTNAPRFLLSAIRQMKFFSAVRPETRVTLKAKKVGTVDQLLQFEVEALVDGKTVAAGQLVLSRDHAAK
jgi:3-hydroxyacyl-[acyl-carrier-protein] dehydratase